MTCWANVVFPTGSLRSGRMEYDVFTSSQIKNVKQLEEVVVQMVGPVAFLAPQVVVNLAWGVAFIVSALIGRPLTGVLAAEMVDMPPEVRASATYRRVFGRISAAWGAYMVVRSAVRFALLAWVGVDAFVASNLLTGAPVMALLMTWSIWYGTRGFRTSEEWGWAFEPQVVPATP